MTRHGDALPGSLVCGRGGPWRWNSVDVPHSEPTGVIPRTRGRRPKAQWAPIPEAVRMEARTRSEHTLDRQEGRRQPWAVVTPQQNRDHDLGDAHGHEADKQRGAGRRSPALEGPVAVRREAEERPHLARARRTRCRTRPGGRNPARERGSRLRPPCSRSPPVHTGSPPRTGLMYLRYLRLPIMCQSTFTGGGSWPNIIATSSGVATSTICPVAIHR